MELSTPTPDGDGFYTWNSVLANPASYRQLIAISVDDQPQGVATILPPRPSDPNSLTVFCYTKDSGLGVKADVPFSAIPKAGHTTAGDSMIVDKTSKPTNTIGYASFPLAADSGIYRLSLGTIIREIDTTGCAGQNINFKDLPQ